MQFIKLFSIKRCGLLVLLFSLAACQTAPETIKQAEQTAETNEVQVPLSEKEKLLQAPNYYLQTSASDDAKAAFEKALTYKKEGKLALAKQHFTNLTLQYPNLSGAYLQLAYLAKQAEQSTQYLEYLEAAVNANKYNYYAANELALLKREKGEFSEALALYDSAIASWPGFAASYINKGILLDLYLDQKEQAVAVYNTYLMLVPEESQSYRQVATWLVDLEHQLKQRGANENG
ncbi:MAG: hypothetical protein ACPGVL_00035 [Pseudoalteromonas spongiae]|uniref:hypothetical protein n=1 Tax=Pseudoalteromonas spongiae TaxID=298657 RepID=UPI00110AB6CE|nr:hypothetical protein [Pseudoalteromonas spongiae]TMO85576.1 hypothetical protein CWC15_07585 [Pseudoalteromonas spongiae]